jgi:hypothetical protein
MKMMKTFQVVKLQIHRKELKEIGTGSVHKALEKSIASSLVELAVSELKTQVRRWIKAELDKRQLFLLQDVRYYRLAQCAL